MTARPASSLSATTAALSVEDDPRVQVGVLAALPKLQCCAQSAPLGGGTPFTVVNQGSEHLRVRELIRDRRYTYQRSQGNARHYPARSSIPAWCSIEVESTAVESTAVCPFAHADKDKANAVTNRSRPGVA